MNLRNAMRSSILGRWINARSHRLSHYPTRAWPAAEAAAKRPARSVRDAARVVMRCDMRSYRTSARENDPWERNGRSNPAEHMGGRGFLEKEPPADRPRLAPLPAPAPPLSQPLAARRPAADGVSPVRDDAPCPALSSGNAGRLGKEPIAAPRPNTPNCSNGSADRAAENGARTPSANKDGSESRADACLARKWG